MSLNHQEQELIKALIEELLSEDFVDKLTQVVAEGLIKKLNESDNE